MDVQEAYNRWSATYDSDRNLTRDLSRAVTRQALAGRRFTSALEIGCGTGENTPFFAQISAAVLAVDFSNEMLARAVEKVRASRVRFSVQDLTRPWPYPGRAFDLIACNLVLEHIADLPALFAEAARCLQPGGLFFVCELHPFRQYQGTKARFDRDAGRVEIPAFVHHISDFLHAAKSSGLALLDLQEGWHAEDQGKPPRVVSFLFSKPTGDG